MKWCLGILFFAALQGAALAEEEAATGFVNGPPVELDRDVRIPKSVVDEVIKIFKKVSFDEHDAVAEGDSNPVIPRQNLKMKIYFKEKSAGILGGKDLALTPPAGGGQVDLSKMIHRRRGSFYWRVELLPDLASTAKDKPVVTKVYFLSRHIRHQRPDGPAIGMGCNKLADISGQFQKTLGTEGGQLLNTSYGTHLGTLIGTYYFFVITNDAIKVATLTFNDPRAREVVCAAES